MIVIGADTHKRTHTVVALDAATGRELGQLTFSSEPDGALEALTWGVGLGAERVWLIEDVRHVCGRLERELICYGQAVIGVSPRLMAGVRPAGGCAARATRSTPPWSRWPRSALAWICSQSRGCRAPTWTCGGS